MKMKRIPVTRVESRDSFCWIFSEEYRNRVDFNTVMWCII